MFDFFVFLVITIVIVACIIDGACRAWIKACGNEKEDKND